jgi:hypothetical protein
MAGRSGNRSNQRDKIETEAKQSGEIFKAVIQQEEDEFQDVLKKYAF